MPLSAIDLKELKDIYEPEPTNSVGFKFADKLTELKDIYEPQSLPAKMWTKTQEVSSNIVPKLLDLKEQFEPKIERPQVAWGRLERPEEFTIPRKSPIELLSPTKERYLFPTEKEELLAEESMKPRTYLKPWKPFQKEM